MIYWFHLLGRRLVRLLPLATSYRLAAAGGSVVYLAWPEKRRHAIANYLQVLGPRGSRREARRLAHAAFRNYGCYIVDVLRLSDWRRDAIEDRLTVDGMEHVAAARAHGKGMILVGGHIGNSDLGGAILAGRGHPVSVVVETLQPPRWNAEIQAARRRAGVGVIDATASPREFLEVLRRNEVLAILVDRPTHCEGEGMPVHFFGGWTRIPSGVALLALRTGASIVAGCLTRTNTGYHVQVTPVAPVERTRDLQADIQQLTQHVMAAIEDFIRQHPDEWFMFRAMWPQPAMTAYPNRDATQSRAAGASKAR